MTQPLRIAVVTETHPPEVNGVAMTVLRLINGMRARGHNITVVRPRQQRRETPLEHEWLVGGLPLPGYPGLRFGLPASGYLKRGWLAQRPDAVHVVTEGPLGWSAVQAARKLGIPVSSGYHTNFDRYSRHYGASVLKPAISRWLRHFHRSADATLVPTPELAGELGAQGIPGVRVVGRGVDTALFSPMRRDPALRARWGVAHDGLAVLYVGRIAPEKNLTVVEAAFRKIAAQHKNARMVWVGDGPARAALARAHPDHHFAGARYGNDLATHYASADLFLFPSLTETFGNVTVEAMASGLAVLAYDCAAAALLIRNGENGLKVREDDRAAFIDAAVQIASNEDLRARLGEAARSSVLHLGWDTVVADFETSLRDTIARGGVRAA
ncbi:glycosyltransferase family 1 protein [Niveibacterium umoris]|uniref:Glycosyltransferase involved in cell wall biosynthesis n=1 Tax=Niveibacterium umoris TaxID=1193620 RepID=A0A840BTH0_9RHOO|nr:glycosyltransferase family 1 protein [Niveibacterium umoris]MBB4014818.1 glycosyltransferase involved in cell wall biosynthesis [Niveibacterium umoris]